MNLGSAIVTAALILAAGYVLGNLYKVQTTYFRDAPVIYAVNTLTGTVKYCVAYNCSIVREPAPAAEKGEPPPPARQR
jgi:hypothetical protein